MNAEEEFDRWTTWPEWAKDALHSDTRITFSWRDRVRVLFGRQPTVTVKTFLPFRVEQEVTLSRVYVPPLWQRRHRGMYEVAAPPAPPTEPTAGATS